MTKILCDVYKTRKKEEMYLYVSRTDGLDRVPDALKEQFGKPELAMTMMLSADKRLGRAKAEDVMKALAEQGFYLQMPPAPEKPDLPDLFTRRDQD